MSCNLIQVVRGRKVARAITSEQEYRQLRGTDAQQTNLRLARAGNESAKRRLVQFNYSGHYPDGMVKGNKLPSAAFGFDLDNREDFERAAAQLLADPERYGLLMLERSARQGGHAVFKREYGRTILENQVRIAMELRCEMDTSTHDINRVYFSTTDDPDELLYVSPQLFTDVYDPFTVFEEANCLEERESFGQEELPPGAHKANKHFRPFGGQPDSVREGVVRTTSRSTVQAAVAGTAGVNGAVYPTTAAGSETGPTVQAGVTATTKAAVRTKEQAAQKQKAQRPSKRAQPGTPKALTREQVVERAVEKVVDNSVDKSVNNTVDNVVDETVDRNVDGVVHKSVRKSVDKAVDNSVDKPVHKSVDNAVHNVVDNSAEGLAEGSATGMQGCPANGLQGSSTDGSMDGSTNASEEGSANGLQGCPTGGSEQMTVHKTVHKPVHNPVDNSVHNSVNKGVETCSKASSSPLFSNGSAVQQAVGNEQAISTGAAGQRAAGNGQPATENGQRFSTGQAVHNAVPEEDQPTVSTTAGNAQPAATNGQQFSTGQAVHNAVPAENQPTASTTAVNAQRAAANGQRFSTEQAVHNAVPEEDQPEDDLTYRGIPYSAIITAWWARYNNGQEPIQSNRDTLTFELAVNLRHICGFDREQMDRIIPCYDRFPQAQKMKCIDSALAEKRTTMPKRLRDILNELAPLYNSKAATDAADNSEMEEGEFLTDPLRFYDRLPVLPQGPKESVDAIGPTLAMPGLTAICPAIGALATDVKLVVHGKECNLNLISYIVGECASNKGSIDPVIDTWMWEIKAFDKMYLQQEDEWRAKKRMAKNQKDQPDEPKLPIRCLTLNNTVANLAERLSNTEGKHAFSFTPEADTVAQKWKSAMCDFSVMLRQSYDGTRYEREARSADAVNVHIDKLLWNVTMCGTPDALYRVVNNYTDGFQTRLAVARTPDNTFSPLADQPDVLTPERIERIRQVAHLLPLMAGTIDLPLLEQKGRAWLEQIRQLTLKNDDKVMARQRFRICVTAQRMTCCLLLCQVCEELIREFGLYGAEKRLKLDPGLWIPRLFEAEKGPLLAVYDLLADALMETALYYFRERIENAYQSKSYAGTSQARRLSRGKNDSIYERLDVRFTFEQAMQYALMVKGVEVTRNAVHQMLKNWRTQGLIERLLDGKFRKLS